MHSILQNLFKKLDIPFFFIAEGCNNVYLDQPGMVVPYMSPGYDGVTTYPNYFFKCSIFHVHPASILYKIFTTWN